MIYLDDVEIYSDENYSHKTYFKNFSCHFRRGEIWAVVGENGAGKNQFLALLDGKLKASGNYKNDFASSAVTLSGEAATELINIENSYDDSQCCEGGVDIGRTVADYFKGAPLDRSIRLKWFKERESANINESKANEAFLQNSLIANLNIAPLFDRGIKYLSTGEIRKVLFAKAFLQSPRLVILNNFFDGLDISARNFISSFLEEIAKKQLSQEEASCNLIFGAENFSSLPSFVSHIIEIKNFEVSFCGKKSDYKSSSISYQTKPFPIDLTKIAPKNSKNILVEMNKINISYNGKFLFKDFSFTVREGECYRICGPNGCGKTTLMELISGENMQVFSNDIKIFGKRRGSGETIWDLKKQMGVVSYRLHLDYLRVASTTALEVVLSGLKESIGLYETCSVAEIELAKSYLDWGGFEGDYQKPFSYFDYGQQRRLLILRAVIKMPKILILDEPCHALDENSKTTILELLNELGERKITTILHVTHEQSSFLPCEKNILNFYEMQQSKNLGQ